ncbi:uncharacterized protein [Rutidosis leptorrhynchoides]|uniref:uncharacterized protein n=1 Tax=Rutidosis leptorrhynchoides TaxID=125765 RepID=UPI003A9A6486
MEGKENICEYRARLDKTLMCHDLSNVESLKTLVKNQMSNSTESEEYSDNLVQKRTREVANFISMLRSASGKSVEGSRSNEIPHEGWKIKHDNQDCRVMYKEGPEGTPFHNLLVEGYVDGPLDVCMCISWEAELYQKWWPQFNIPAFKVISSECVKNIRIGEQISLVRMKISWPISAREALIHYVSLDYIQDDLIIVLLNSISETENIDKSTHGFTKDGIPREENVTRIDVVGGLALQKVSANRSYFRAIANMDVKLDFIPPAIINFVSRQIIGSGFKLYKKKVASVTEGDEDFSKVLKEPFYARIRETFYSENNVPNGFLKQEDNKINHEVLEQKEIKIVDEVTKQETVNAGQLEEVNDHRLVSEIEEIDENGRSDEDDNTSNISLVVGKKEIIISPEVNQALGTLETVISIFREFAFNPRSLSLSRFVNNVFADLEENKLDGSRRFVTELPMRNSHESSNSFSGHSSRYKDRELGSASREDETSSSHKTHRSSFSFVVNEAITSTFAENGIIKSEVNNTNESHLTKKKMKKLRFCCASFTSGRVNA